MTDYQGRFVWYELTTTDQEAAKSFYGTVAGWEAQPSPMAGYTLFTAGGTPVAGLMDQPEECRRLDVPPAWTGYVAVEDVDAVTERAAGLGGAVQIPPTDIPEIGRFSVITDPQGAWFALFRAAKPEQARPHQPDQPGNVVWHELLAADREAAFAFYAALFGWEKAEALDMGELGTYQIFSAGGQNIGGMFTKPPAIPVPHWLFYLNAGDIDAAIGRVTAAGGRVLNGPMAIPGGAWVIQGQDPQGAGFALFGTRG